MNFAFAPLHWFAHHILFQVKWRWDSCVSVTLTPEPSLFTAAEKWARQDPVFAAFAMKTKAHRRESSASASACMCTDSHTVSVNISVAQIPKAVALGILLWKLQLRDNGYYGTASRIHDPCKVTTHQYSMITKTTERNSEQACTSSVHTLDPGPRHCACLQAFLQRARVNRLSGTPNPVWHLTSCYMSPS